MWQEWNRLCFHKRFYILEQLHERHRVLDTVFGLKSHCFHPWRGDHGQVRTWKDNLLRFHQYPLTKTNISTTKFRICLTNNDIIPVVRVNPARDNSEPISRISVIGDTCGETPPSLSISASWNDVLISSILTKGNITMHVIP